VIGVEVTEKSNADKLRRDIASWQVELLGYFAAEFTVGVEETLRESGQVSVAGRPPNVHSPAPNLETTDHEVDRKKLTVRVGSIYIQGSAVTPALPGLLERGGYGRIRSRRKSTKSRKSLLVKKYFARRPYVEASARRALIKFKRKVAEGL